MLYTIKKHPLAFLHCLGWVGIGACMAYVMRYETAGYYEAMFADVCVILSGICLALIPLTLLLGIILKLVRKQLPSQKREKSFLHSAAKRFESTLPGFRWYYLLITLAAVLPVLAFFSVVLVDKYVAAVLFLAIGISIWLCFVCYEWPESRLMQVRDTAPYFHIQPGAEEGLLNRLYKQGAVYGIPQTLWDGRRDALYNMLLRTGATKEGSTVAGHRFSTAEAAGHFGMDRNDFTDEDVVWIPLRPLLSHADNSSSAAIRGLFVHHLERIADRQYETTANRLPEDYPYSSREKRLIPDEDALLRESRRGLRLVAATAEDPDVEEDTLYQGCMLLLEGAQLADVKWDHFEDLSQTGDREYFLSAEEAQTFYRLLLEDAFAYEICSLTYLDECRQLAIEIWTEPEETSGKRVKGEARTFVMDDGMNYMLLLRYEGIKWHWLHTRKLGVGD